MNKENKCRYLCPCCFQDSGINVKNRPRVEFNIDKDTEVETALEKVQFVTSAYLDIWGTCPHCEEEVQFLDIDEGFVRILQIMNNEKNYNTLFCCEGHKDDPNNYDIPYFIFEAFWDDKEYYEEILNIVPDGWEIYRTPIIEDGFTCCYTISMYCRDIFKYPFYMISLMDFVNKLPRGRKMIK
jgi:hypothetical protein